MRTPAEWKMWHGLLQLKFRDWYNPTSHFKWNIQKCFHLKLKVPSFILLLVLWLLLLYGIFFWCLKSSNSQLKLRSSNCACPVASFIVELRLMIFIHPALNNGVLGGQRPFHLTLLLMCLEYLSLEVDPNILLLKKIIYLSQCHLPHLVFYNIIKAMFQS